MIQTANSIGYCGFAKLKKMRGNQIVEEHEFHNNGTKYLFGALAQTLCGQNTTSMMPKYFDLGAINAEGEYQCFLSHRATLTSKYETNYSVGDSGVAEVAAVFTAYIPTNSIVDITNPVTTLALYATYSLADGNSTRLASIDVSDYNITLQNSNVYSYIVEWVMTFSNVVTVASTSIEV